MEIYESTLAQVRIKDGVKKIMWIRGRVFVWIAICVTILLILYSWSTQNSSEGVPSSNYLHSTVKSSFKKSSATFHALRYLNPTEASETISTVVTEEENKDENYGTVLHVSTTPRIENTVHEKNDLRSYKKVANAKQITEVLRYIKERKEIYKQRNRKAIAVCKRYQKVLMRIPDASSVIWDKQHGIGYCKNAKAGTTSWLKQFINWSGKIIKFSANSTSTDIHERANSLFQPLSTYAMSKERNKKRAFIFTVVRHPFTRLVSAYRDKIVRGYRKDVQEEMIKSYRNVSSSNHDATPTFREFILFVCNEIRKCRPMEINSACLKDIDVHWMPMFERCSPCAFKFEVISKIETFDEDMKFIKMLVDLKKRNMKEAKFSPTSNNFIQLHSSEGNTTTTLAKYFQDTLSKAEVDLIYEAYFFDFVLFNYTKNIL